MGSVFVLAEFMKYTSASGRDCLQFTVVLTPREIGRGPDYTSLGHVTFAACFSMTKQRTQYNHFKSIPSTAGNVIVFKTENNNHLKYPAKV